MKKYEPRLLADVLEEIKQRQNLAGRLAEIKALELWDKVVGSSVARQTVFKDVRDKVLVLRIGSAPLRQEISMNRSMIVEEINRLIGKETIQDIRFI